MADDNAAARENGKRPAFPVPTTNPSGDNYGLTKLEYLTALFLPATVQMMCKLSAEERDAVLKPGASEEDMPFMSAMGMAERMLQVMEKYRP